MSFMPEGGDRTMHPAMVEAAKVEAAQERQMVQSPLGLALLTYRRMLMGGTVHSFVLKMDSDRFDLVRAEWMAHAGDGQWTKVSVVHSDGDVLGRMMLRVLATAVSDETTETRRREGVKS